MDSREEEEHKTMVGWTFDRPSINVGKHWHHQIKITMSYPHHSGEFILDLTNAKDFQKLLTKVIKDVEEEFKEDQEKFRQKTLADEASKEVNKAVPKEVDARDVQTLLKEAEKVHAVTGGGNERQSNKVREPQERG